MKVMCFNCNQKAEVLVHFCYPTQKPYCIQCAKEIIVTEHRYFTAIGGGTSIIVEVKMGLETKENALKRYKGWPVIEAQLNAL